MNTNTTGRGRGRGRGRGGQPTSSAPRGLPRGGPPRGFAPPPRGPPRGGPPSGFAPPPRAFHQGPPRGPRGTGRGGPGAIFMQDRPPTVDARLQDGSDAAAIARLEGTGPNGLPLRPSFGTQGRPVVLRANYFPVRVTGEVYQYRVDMVLGDRKTLSRRVKQRVFALAARTEAWRAIDGRVAHDGAEKLVAACRLEPEPLVIRGIYYEEDQQPEEGLEYVLTLVYVTQVDQSILDGCLAGDPVDSQALSKVLSALNIVLTARPSQTGVKVGKDDETKKNPDQRLFFNEPVPKDIGGGLQVRQGFYVSARPAHQQLMVNVNTCHAAFYKPQNFVAAMGEYLRLGGNQNDFGRQVQVRTPSKSNPNGNIVMIRGLSGQNAREHQFEHKKHGFVSVEQYYQLEYGITLEKPHLPLLQDPKGNMYPPELCEIIPDQGFKGELSNPQHAKAMLDVACKLPKDNANEIVNRGLDLLEFRDNPLLDSFGIQVGTEMAVVPGRVLDKPGLSYSAAKAAPIDDRASWNLRDVKFAVGARLERWAMLVIQDGGEFDFGDEKEARGIADGFQRMCNKSGMRMEPLPRGAYEQVQLPPKVKGDSFRDDAMEVIEKAMKALVTRTRAELVLVLLSNEDKAIYNGIKRLCDIQLDVASVCMQSAKVKSPKGQVQYYANVALKVNMKMGGINHTLDANSGMWLKRAPTMVMGMDVTHPAKGPSVAGTPSIVAVIASVDDRFAQYPAALALRESKVEIERQKDTSDTLLRDMFISRFELYKTRNQGKLPQRVILFRDGVSESQYVQVRDHELTVMKDAFKHMGNYRPKLSIVICGKRHHTRFYPTDAKDAAHDGNPLPGTVVDRGITPAYEFDFFLQAHGGLKGTTRPTHYFVVHDENGFSADDLQRVTNDLSYMFARATKAVSLVSPAYWADIACERGRCYLHKLLAGGKDEGKGKKGGDSVSERADKLWGGGVSGKLKDTMFYL